jgi:hypothetical protein
MKKKQTNSVYNQISLLHKMNVAKIFRFDYLESLILIWTGETQIAQNACCIEA